jgi:hypothetical protein
MHTEEKKNVNSNEMMVKLADLWKNLKDEDRKKYHDMAEKEKLKYLLELNQFYQTHPFEVIQNKTKKNHVKKPSSAYGLFLREAKTVVKTEHPELKMADILKIVAERWKRLDEGTRIKYQQAAKKEKEAANAKISEQSLFMADERNDLTSFPQKRLQSQKRVKKALIRENQKYHNVVADESQMIGSGEETSGSSPFEEAVFAPTTDIKSFEMFDGFQDDHFALQEIPSFTFDRTFSTDKFINKFASKDERPVQNNFESLKELKPKKSNDFLKDLLNFHSRQDTFVEKKCSVTDFLFNMPSSTSSNNFMKSSNKQCRQVFNDTLMNCLSFEPANDFSLDFMNLDEMTFMN